MNVGLVIDHNTEELIDYKKEEYNCRQALEAAKYRLSSRKSLILTYLDA